MTQEIENTDGQGPTGGLFTIRFFLGSIVMLAAVLVVYRLLLFHFWSTEELAALLRPLLSTQPPWLSHIGFVFILCLALLAPGSAAVVVLLGVPLFGATPTYAMGLIAGTVSSVVSHQFGRCISRHNWSWQGSKRFRTISGYVRSNPGRVRITAFLTRALPNPFYDAWGVAFGALGIPLSTYLPPAIGGGAILLALVCYLPRL